MSQSLHKTPPGPRGYPLLGSLPQLVMQDPLAVLSEAMNNYGDIIRLKVGPSYIYIVNHPEYVKHVLLDNYRNYGKSGDMWEPVRAFMGTGVLVRDGDDWLRHRRSIQPAFHRQELANISTLMTDTIAEHLPSWETYADTGTSIDIMEEMLDKGLEIILKVMFSSALNHEDKTTLHENFTVIIKLLVYRMMTFFLPKRIPRPGDKRFNTALENMDNVLYRLIEERRNSQNDYQDLLSMLMNMRYDDTHEGLTTTELRDEIITLLATGHETTAVALTWVWYLLSQHPEAEAKVQAEIDTVLNGRIPTMEDIHNLPYSWMVVQEALRLYPPVWPLPRTAVEDDEIDGYHIPAGAHVIVSPYLVHRHPEFWPDPETFDPERFLPERVNERPRFSYIAFGGGPRLCIGYHFAMIEAVFMMGMVVPHYQLRVEKDFEMIAHSGITIRPRDGLPMTIHRR